ncbi:MAG: 2-oxoacid:ferredoxin oxidoreductase subunit beta [Anaerolineales bacterium]
MARRGNENLLGLTKKDYDGRPTTLCVGCGHNSISSQIVQMAWEIGLEQHNVIKLSGIGCSSKSPAYFLGASHGFNALHGRMPSVATGATTVNRKLVAIGVSGDGDTGSIGLGQFKHMVRRNVPMVYIIENNGVYGLTKGQFSATADKGQQTKYADGGKINELTPIDLCYEALIGGAGFVARSFSGDKHQVQELLKAAVHYEGLAVIDIISPCVTFNDHETSSKSYAWVKEYKDVINDVSYVAEFDEIQVDYDAGQTIRVQMHDGGFITLNKLDDTHDPTDRMSAIRLLEEKQDPHDVLTGLLYINENNKTSHDLMELPETPLVELGQADLRPSRDALADAMQRIRTTS